MHHGTEEICRTPSLLYLQLFTGFCVTSSHGKEDYSYSKLNYRHFYGLSCQAFFSAAKHLSIYIHHTKLIPARAKQKKLPPLFRTTEECSNTKWRRKRKTTVPSKNIKRKFSLTFLNFCLVAVQAARQHLLFEVVKENKVISEFSLLQTFSKLDAIPHIRFIVNLISFSFEFVASVRRRVFTSKSAATSLLFCATIQSPFRQGGLLHQGRLHQRKFWEIVCTKGDFDGLFKSGAPFIPLLEYLLMLTLLFVAKTM